MSYTSASTSSSAFEHCSLLRAGLALVLFLLVSCGGEPAQDDKATKITPSPADIERATSMQPADEALARIYNRSCRNCHGITGVGAPLTGHAAAWEPRLEARGREGLLASTKFGYRFMPARGLCPACSDDEYLALIDFMVGRD
ncbi:MAG: c-type cytochrome [Gammaproteobacteria bacterium]|nr:c-type cytochrome [Gammaproteobacteria bacterium]